jgi:hypothetical protein
MTMAARLAALALLLAALGAEAAAQDVVRAATSPAPNLRVVLSWPKSPGVPRFNLYRKDAAAPAYPATPLNPTPLAVMTSCPAIQAVIPNGSEEWILLARSLTDDPNDPMSPPFDPCAIATIAPGSDEAARLELIARGSYRVAIVIGQGFIDTTVTAGQSYSYQLRGVAASGAETGAIGNDVAIVAGVPAAPPPPAPVASHPGDRQVLLVFGDVPGAAGFIVRRATNPAGPFVRVNERVFTARFQHDLDGNLLTPGGAYFNGFIDFQHFDAAGSPIAHVVEGNPVDGPDDGVTYYYQVASVDLLQQPGAFSAPAVAATPVDKTPPATPTEVTVAADEVVGTLQVTWVKVQRDVLGHADAGVASYRVYRYETSEDVAAPNVQIALVPHVSGGQTTMSAIDADPGLRSEHGPKTWWYRVEADDVQGNVGTRSAAAAGTLKDVTAPKSPTGVEAEGFEDHIQVRWSLNDEPDLGGYEIYRSLCHLGDWVPCPPRREPDRREDRPGHAPPSEVPKPKPPPDPCSGPFVLIGTLTQIDARLRAAARPDGKAVFDDVTVPLGSPLCYAYLIKAIDTSLNRSGSWPIPDVTKEEIPCQRLRDRTPPEGAIITGLFARDNAIEVHWIGAPIQDIGAWHVYRSESEAGPYAWAGGYTVGYPPAPSVVLTAPYKPAFAGCDAVPVQAIESMSSGALVDVTVRAKIIYWYKVAGVDQVGNETPLTNVIPVSTFTFTSTRAPAPVVGPITKSDAPCGLKVTWTPAFDATQYSGFAVFRSASATGVYLQLGNVVEASEFVDPAVIPGREYWYQVGFLDRKGKLSMLSVPVMGKLP